MTREQIEHVQRVIQAPETGVLDETTKAKLRGWQLTHGLEPSGTVDKATAQRM